MRLIPTENQNIRRNVLVFRIYICDEATASAEKVNTRCLWHQLKYLSYKWKFEKTDNTFIVIYEIYERVLDLHSNLRKKSRYINISQKCNLWVLRLLRFKMTQFHASLFKISWKWSDLPHWKMSKMDNIYPKQYLGSCPNTL